MRAGEVKSIDETQRNGSAAIQTAARNYKGIKHMKLTDKNAVEIYNKGGAVASSDWMRGSGNFVAARPTPEKCVKILAKNIGELCGFSKRAVQELLLERPRVRKVIVVKDWQAVRQLAKTCV